MHPDLPHKFHVLLLLECLVPHLVHFYTSVTLRVVSCLPLSVWWPAKLGSHFIHSETPSLTTFRDPFPRRGRPFASGLFSDHISAAFHTVPQGFLVSLAFFHWLWHFAFFIFLSPTRSPVPNQYVYWRLLLFVFMSHFCLGFKQFTNRKTA